MKKTIAKHILGLIGTGILWVILNMTLNELFIRSAWLTDIDNEGGQLLIGMLIGYPVVYWAVKTIWFTKDEN